MNKQYLPRWANPFVLTGAALLPIVMAAFLLLVAPTSFLIPIEIKKTAK